MQAQLSRQERAQPGRGSQAGGVHHQYGGEEVAVGHTRGHVQDHTQDP